MTICLSKPLIGPTKNENHLILDIYSDGIIVYDGSYIEINNTRFFSSYTRYIEVKEKIL